MSLFNSKLFFPSTISIFLIGFLFTALSCSKYFHSEKEITEIERKNLGFSRLQSEYYEKYVLGKWSKEDFEREKGLLGKKKAELEILKERQVAIFEKEVFELEERHKYLTALFKGKTKKWDKDFVDSIIDKIFIGKDNTIEIKFNFEETPVITEKLGRKTRRS